MLKKLFLVLMILTLFLVVSGCKQQSSETQAYIQGKVFDSNTGVGITKKVIVKAVGAGGILYAETEDSGNYIITGVGFGTYEVSPSVNPSFIIGLPTRNVTLSSAYAVEPNVDFTIDGIPYIPGI